MLKKKAVYQSKERIIQLITIVKPFKLFKEQITKSYTHKYFNDNNNKLNLICP
jgi:hypothetical protein